MSRFTATIIAVLVLLVAVQSWRLHDAQSAIADALAIQRAQPGGATATAGKPQVGPHFLETERTEQLLHDAPGPEADESIAKTWDAFLSTGKESDSTSRVDTDSKKSKRTAAKLARAMQKHSGEAKDKQGKKGGSAISRQISTAMQSIRQGDYSSALSQLQTAEQSQSLSAKDYK
ncbi:MAG: hypothetical protein K1Y02_16275, partial [Candidatus Hydrogenedentes bacterium]|nr:hypothetical protein [Candidatus Hydrogenedentota bacterium]